MCKFVQIRGGHRCNVGTAVRLAGLVGLALARRSEGTNRTAADAVLDPIPLLPPLTLVIILSRLNVVNGNLENMLSHFFPRLTENAKPLPSPTVEVAEHATGRVLGKGNVRCRCVGQNSLLAPGHEVPAKDTPMPAVSVEF